MIHDSDERPIGSSPWVGVIVTLVAAVIVGVWSFLYVVSTYQRGGGPLTFWATAVRWLPLAAPVAVLVGGFLCVFPAARRRGILILVAGVGLVIGFVGIITAFWIAMESANVG